jgi:hypothetical protein
MGQSPSGMQPEPLASDQLLPLDVARKSLATVWLGASSVILTIVALQSLIGKFGDRTQDAWGWLLPTLMPSLSMIITVLGYTALDSSYSKSVVRKTFFRIALFSSMLYLLLVLLTILIEPLTGKDPIELMHMSNLWLGPLQGLVASAHGVLFVSKPAKKQMSRSVSTS